VLNIGSEIAQSTDDIVETGVSRELVERAIAELGTWRKAPDSAIWYSIFWAEGVKQG
jgi:hypothetical protein